MAYKNISLKRNGTEKIFRDNIDHQFKKKNHYSEYIKLKSINKIFIHLGNIKVFF